MFDFFFLIYLHCNSFALMQIIIDYFIHHRFRPIVGLYFLDYSDYSDYSDIQLSFFKNGPIKTQFYTFVTMVSKNWTEYSHSWKLYWILHMCNTQK
jgi:hypothetical protein